ncbi:aspartic peptidase domain-containing protein [Truncatella angustata]|uniref:Aspartic peptidase domain-containing protein n=1 Tax=Truncatella angustata TaxID=152316 RepID=A0A9P8ZVB1_9PEZI|nr:aspartic peptidase domain-containing protein [Truncatella angustata]KAH6652439.1 aspartic peptidase domain-containing protein [Truncatella angustata]KAH8202097.1 hypothetical protein TruAng_003765 [Truncatella angustata]
MKTSALSAVAAAFLSLPSEVVAHVRLPFARQSTTSQSTTERRSVPADIFSAENTYVVNATVGTPPQNLSFALTLSADESWVPDAQYCDADSTYLRYEGCIYGSYNHNVSSTFVRPGTGSFSASYLDGTYAYGDRIRETIGFLGGSSVSNLTMGLAQQSNLWMGVMALGFNDSYSVPNLPDRMLADGLINSTAYSLWIESEDAATGSLLFGAIDTAAIDGTLKRFQVQREHYSSTYSYYTTSNTFDVYIQSFNATRTNDGSLSPLIQNTTALPLITIDPTYSVSVLPEEIATAIWALAGAAYDDLWDYATIPCDYRNNLTGSLAIQLDSVGADGGPILNVPLSDLIVSEDIWSHSSWDYDTNNSTTTCLFGVQTTNDTSYTFSSYEDNWTLGSGMLRRQYMVFDLANEEVAMAPVKFGSVESDSDVIPFSVYGAKIPESTGDDSKCYADDECSSSGSTSRGGSSSGSDNSDSLSGDVIGMIVGFSILGVAMLAVAIWGIIRCCRDNSKYGRTAVVAEKGALDEEDANRAQQTSSISPGDAAARE